MSAGGSADSAAPNLNLTPEEKRVYGLLFRQADSENVGVVTGETAVQFFEKTRLDSRILGEIWQIADSENRGFLTPAGFSIVLRLIGFAQNGREPTTELAKQPGPLPQFDGMQLPGLSSPTPAAAPLQAQGTGGVPVRIPPLTPEKVNQYAGLFERQTLQPGGLLAGDQAKSIFEKSGIPNETLGRIWQLADTEQRGALVQTEFVIAMHLLTSMKSGALRGLPTILPAPLYEAATRRGSAPRQSPSNTGTPSAIPRQMSGNQPIRTASPLGRPPVTAQSASDWAVTPADKARFDQLYDTLDKSRKGFITGEEAVPFLSQSNLPEDSLAQIWDLADVKGEGNLNRDTFAVAMFLIRQQRTGSGPLPGALPQNLIPPSMRQATQQPSASPFDAPPPAQPQAQQAAPPPAPKSAMDDLFGLDSSSSPPPAQAQTSQTTGGSNANDPFASSQTPTSPVRPSPGAGSQFKPFVPSSSFGRGLTTHATGESTGSGAGATKASEDLLGDADPEVSKKLTNETSELGNLSNQVSTLSKQMGEVQGQRTATQNEFNQASAQKKNFEQRLAQLRTLYEKEASDLQQLQEQLSTARKDTQKLQSECMTLDTTYRDLHTQHQQVVQALEADRQENAQLKEKIRAVNTEISQLKPQIEKLKSEARQQKGLVAINKKQLSTNEGERDKLQSESAELAKGNFEGISRQDTGSSAPGSGSVASPAASVSSGNNPFFKRTGSTDIMGAFASPSIKPAAADQSFDDIFGTAAPAAGSGATSPPPPAFQPQTTGASTGSANSFATPPAASPAMSRQATMGGLEPPAPPESRQISSNSLPFAGASESLSSSRAVSPPASRNEDPVEEITTPTQTAPGGFPEASTPPAQEQQPKDASAVPGADDPFAATDSDKAKADFENAFASFTKAHKPADASNVKDPKSSSAFDSEFPPISELERDEDSSDSDSERGGFDDDFAPAEPAAQKTGAATVPGAAATSTAFPDVPESGAKKDDRSDSFSSQQSIPVVAAPAAAPAADDDPFGPDSATTKAATTAAPGSNAPTASKTTFDDLDDEFEGLEDAKEGSADDDFQTISRSGLEDYNPVFDSSPPQSQAKSESTTAPFGQESSYDFGNVSQPAANPGGSGEADADTTKKEPVGESHDWDAIFASLDSPSATNAAPSGPAAAENEASQPAPAVAERSGSNNNADGKEDDPILKNLTSMGYSREASLLALEKYDYNLERAANHLASQS